MRWYVSRNGETQGPLDEAMITQWGRAGQLVPGLFVRDEAGGNWMPVEQSPFAPMVVGGPPSAAAATTGGSEALGIIILLAPLLSTALVWLWVGNMNLLQDPEGTLSVLMMLTVAGTAVLIAVEAGQLGMGKRPNSKGKKDSGPVVWFIASCLVWIIAFPWYLAARGNYGRKRLWIGGILTAVIFLGSAITMSSAIEAKKAQLRESIQQLQQLGQ